MNNIDRLLNDLNDMFPLSADFWEAVPPMLTEKRKKSGYIFLKPGTIAVKAWQLLTGFIVMFKEDEEGIESVVRIYYPRQIVTDLKSFFDSAPVTAKFIAIGDVSVLEIKKASVFKLAKYPELNKLVQHISFLDISAAESLTQKLRLPERARVKSFFEEYPVHGLPCQYCASLLNLSEEAYLENKIALENEGVVPVKVIHSDRYLEDAPYSAYKVKAYLHQSFNKPDIGSTDDIAGYFNTTSRTLNRIFKKSFGLTVTKFILKCRMEQALKLLNENNLPVGEVAAAVGYRNIFHFSIEFKKYYGYSPKILKDGKML